MSVLLVTGFAPFGGETRNPSYEAARLLPPRLDDWRVQKAEIPVSYERAWEALRWKLDEYQPDALLLTGQAGGREGITPERYAHNTQSAKAPDADGVVYTDSVIAPELGTLPARADVDAMARAMREADFPAYVSESAGAYVCNRLYFDALRFTKLPCVFLHVPYDTLQTQTAFAMPVARIARALEIAARAWLCP